MPLENSHLRSADYGPAGYTEAGKEFSEKDRAGLKKSYEVLDGALKRLEEGGPLKRAGYLLLRSAYLNDNADPSEVDRWRANRADQRSGWHDLAVAELALDPEIRRADLWVVMPKRMSKDEEKKGEDQSAEICAVFERNRATGLKELEAIHQTAADFGISVGEVERRLEFRHLTKPRTCTVEGCGRVPERQNLCMKHYQRERRSKGKKAS